MRILRVRSLAQTERVGGGGGGGATEREVGERGQTLGQKDRQADNETDCQTMRQKQTLRQRKTEGGGS